MKESAKPLREGSRLYHQLRDFMIFLIVLFPKVSIPGFY